MSENLKKLRKEKKEFLKGKLPAWHKRYEPLSGMANIEHQVEEARKEEQRIKEKLKETKDEQKSIVKRIINVIDSRRGDEARDASTYFNLAREYSNIPTASKLFQQLSDEEDKHSKLLRMLADELERQIKQL
jgi:rubrerythrin